MASGTQMQGVPASGVPTLDTMRAAHEVSHPEAPRMVTGTCLSPSLSLPLCVAHNYGYEHMVMFCVC